MLFSTKAEYGVRLMVELGRHAGSEPVSLSAVAEAERLPLSYLEHLVARLRNADLVTSTRGAHGGYELTRRPDTIRAYSRHSTAWASCATGRCSSSTARVIRGRFSRDPAP